MHKKSFIYLLVLFYCSCSQNKEPVLTEKLDRGVIALQIDQNNVYVGWRLLMEDPEEVSFNVYRLQTGDDVYRKINNEPVTTSTNFIDETIRVGRTYRYRIKKVIDNEEIDTPGEGYIYTRDVTDRVGADPALYIINRPYYSIKLNDEVTINRVGIGDLNGDGAYDFIIQHPQYNTDPYWRLGYWRRSPEPYKLDAYTSKGKFMWRYDMGWAIETGTWYAPFIVYDIDCDGFAEMYAKAGEGDPREIDGRVQAGPEYLVKINGQTGEVVKKTNWIPHRTNRNFLAVGYFDGIHPSLVMQSGTYQVIKIEALNKNLERIWHFESTGEYDKYRGQGGHAILTADVNGNGKDDLIPGTFALNHNGVPLWHTGLGHNDVGQVANIDPFRPGLEIFYGIEIPSPKNGFCLVDAATGEIIWGYEGATVHVHGQGLVADIDQGNQGMECYAGESKGGDLNFLFSSDGQVLSDESMGTLNPLAVWWDADEQKELLIGNNLFKYKGDTLLNNIEGRVLLIADIIGDWREEIITGLPGELRIYSTNIPAETRKVCLMQNRQYRVGVTRSTVGYFNPPQLGL